MTNKRTREEWLDMVHEWRRSNVSRNEWCRKHGICKGSFAYWISKMNAMLEPAKLANSDFLELRDPIVSESRLEIRCSGVSIFLPKDFEENTLHRCLKILKEQVC